jgi:hypothetical protein
MLAPSTATPLVRTRSLPHRRLMTFVLVLLVGCVPGLVTGCSGEPGCREGAVGRFRCDPTAVSGPASRDRSPAEDESSSIPAPVRPE